jgi:nucleotide-binding universal stress UspA family protein
MYHRILVATDGSTLSNKGVDAAIALAAALEAELVVLNVIPRYPDAYFEGAIALGAQEVARAEKQWADAATAIVEVAVQKAREQGVKAKAATLKSDLVAEAIISSSKKHKCDLIVMASHGRRGIKRVLLGSETQHVLTQAAVSVLVLR